MTGVSHVTPGFVAIATLFCLALVDPGDGEAQLSYQSGQNGSPAYEGWIQNEDGSKTMVFGYMNRNWSEELNVPVGKDNFLRPGLEDQGQPTHFRPRRNRFVFKVRVPADFDEELVWTLTTDGKTEHAYGTLGIDQALDDIVIASETGALGVGSSTADVRANRAPVITIESGSQYNVRVGQSVELVVRMDDDGLSAAHERWISRRERTAAVAAAREGPPRLNRGQLRPPIRITVQKAVWHHVSWFGYRSEGDGVPSFDPPQVKTWEDTRTGANSPWAPLWARPPVPQDGIWTTTVSFDKPGTYILRARGDDGALYHDQDVTIVVSAIASE